MGFRQTLVSGRPAIALRSAEIETVVVPALGLRLANLRRLRGREWLRGGERGWSEVLETGTGRDREGEWVSSVFDHPGGTTLAGALRGTGLPYELHREVTLEPAEPLVRLRYRLRHLAGDRFAWIWSARPAFGVQPGSTLMLPTVSQVRIDAVEGRDDLAPGDIVSWAGGVGREQERFVFRRDAAWVVRAFGDVGPSGRMTLTDPRRGERLALTVRPEEVPQVGIRIDCRASELELAPSIGAPDRLEEALGPWGTAQWLEPGEERRWTVEMRLEDGDA